MVDQEPSVLIVDDELSDVDRIKKALAPIRLRISTTSDPHEVLRKVESVLPDLVILDALLPGLSGFDLCKQIKTDPETKSTVVVILTGVYLKDHYRREAVQQFKADGFVTKPFRDKELQRLVLKLLAKKLQKSPGELQESLTHSQDILLSSELEAKPSWFGRIFGRMKTTPAPTVGSGFLHTAAEEGAPLERRPTREAPLGEGSEGIGAGGSGDGEDEEAAEKGVGLDERGETSPDDVGEVVETPVGVTAETSAADKVEQPPRRAEATALEADAAASPREDAIEPSPRAATEEGGESPLRKELEPPSGDGDGSSVERPDEEGDEAVSTSKSLPSSDTGVVDLKSAQAIFDALGDDQATVIEMDEETETERTLPAGVRATLEPAEPEPEIGAGSDSSGAEGTDVAGPEVAPGVPRPNALLQDLPVYREADYMYELKRELSMCNRVGSFLTLIVVRIADLDQIVELLGKEFRPKVLLHVARQALQSIREIDMVGLLESKELVSLTAFASGRYGGERIVCRLRAVLAHNPFQVGVGLPSFIPDLRFGMAVYPNEAGHIDELMEQAEGELLATPHSD